MESGRLNRARFQMDENRRLKHKGTPSIDKNVVDESLLAQGIARSVGFFQETQHEQGYWVGELEGDSILQSEFILLLTWLGEANSEAVAQAAKTLIQQQQPHGGWSLYPGGPVEVSASVKAYLSLKIAGHSASEEMMRRARNAILSAGGVERVNSFTRYYLALLGLIPYKKCPAVPPELILLPNWFPINLSEMSAWSRTIVVPLSFLWAYQPKCELPAEHQIDELYVHSKEKLPITLNTENVVELDAMKKKSRLPWGWFFRQVDKGIKLFEFLRIKPFRKMALRRTEKWMLERFEKSAGLGAIFPPIVWSIIALRCLGYANDSKEMQEARKHLDELVINDERGFRLQPCHSPVWDTAIATLAMREAEVPIESETIQKAVRWLLSKEVREPGDWSQKNRDVEPSGWFFEHENQFYPDVDDTIMVLMVLASCLPGEAHANWRVDFLNRLNHQSNDLPTLISGRSTKPTQAIKDVFEMEPLLNAIRRGTLWTLAMQGKEGGWGAFDANNDREILTRVPFADHNAMIDPATADISARVVEMLGYLGIPADFPPIQKAIQFVRKDQEDDGSWYGRWGVNYIYGTWQVIVGLTAVGTATADPAIEKAADWLLAVQQPDGGWGESPDSYENPSLKGIGKTTPSQTAWALMGLIAAGKCRTPEVEKGIEFLLSKQNLEGSWEEEEFTGTGFPKVFYLRYHLYKNYFPLMALARYRRAITLQKP